MHQHVVRQKGSHAHGTTSQRAERSESNKRSDNVGEPGATGNCQSATCGQRKQHENYAVALESSETCAMFESSPGSRPSASKCRPRLPGGCSTTRRVHGPARGGLAPGSVKSRHYRWPHPSRTPLVPFSYPSRVSVGIGQVRSLKKSVCVW